MGEHTISLRGEVDVANVARRVEPLRTYAAAVSGDLVVDCMDLRFIDAAGLGALVGLNNELRAQGRYLRLIHPAPLLRRVLDACTLNELLEDPMGAAESIRETTRPRAVVIRISVASRRRSTR